jgi:hypothetical protein
MLGGTGRDCMISDCNLQTRVKVADELNVFERPKLLGKKYFLNSNMISHNRYVVFKHQLKIQILYFI